MKDTVLKKRSNTMEFLLVILRSGKTAVVPAASLRIAGKFQKAKWRNGHLYLVRVLAKSNDYDFLQSLYVDRSGIIIFHEDSSSDGKKIHNPHVPADDSEQECLNQTPETDMGKPSCSGISSSAESQVFHDSTIVRSHTVATAEQWVQTDVPSTESKGSQCSVEMINMGVGTVSGDNQPHNVSRHEDQPLMNALVNDVSTSGTVNDNGVDDFMREDLDSHTEDVIGVKKCVHDGADADQSHSTDPRTRPQDNTAELVQGCNVSVPTDELFSIIAQCYNDPRELIRRLTKLVLPKESLLTMTVTGRGKNRQPIPEQVLLAVENCMKQNVDEEIWLSTSEIRLVLTKMLDKMRELQRR